MGSEQQDGEAGGNPWAVTRARALGLSRWPDVMDDLEQGRGLAAHAKVRRHARTSLAGGEKEMVEEALADSRLFAQATSGPPSLSRINGVGTTLIGDRERAHDGTYVKTRWFSVLWVPIVPIDAWLVSDAEGGAWFFYAKVPIARETKVIQRVALGVLAAGALAGVAAIAYATSHADVHLMSGLDVPAEVTIDDLPPFTVAPRGRTPVGLSTGSHRFRCVVKGRVIDERTADVPGGMDLVAYNVAGSAPLVVQQVTYTTGNAKPGNQAAPRSYGGDVFVTLEHCEYPFKTPPDTIKMSSGQRERTVHHAMILDGGWASAVGAGAELESKAKGARVAEGIARALPDDETTVQQAANAWFFLLGNEETVKFAQRLIELAPDSVGARLALQDMRMQVGDFETARTEARAWRASAPKLPAAAALLARVVPADEALPLADEAVRGDPSSAVVHEMALRARYRARRWKEAAANAEFLVSHPAQRGDGLLTCSVRVLHGAGKTAAALAAIETALGNPGRTRGQALTLAGLHGRLRAVGGANAAGRPPADRWLPAIARERRTEGDPEAPPTPAELATARLLLAFHERDEAGLAAAAKALPEDDAVRRTMTLAFAVWREGAEAVAPRVRAQGLPFELCDPVVLIVLGAELGRTGRRAEAQAVHAVLAEWQKSDFPDPALATLPDREAFAVLNEPVLQAALAVAHAARENDSAKRDALLAEARALDVLSEVRAW